MNILDNPAWLNGQFCQIKDLNFSVLDLGVIHCDASYDVACSRDRNIFLLEQHIDRFFKSCNGLRLPLALTKTDALKIITKLCQQADNDSLLIWMGITRGVPTTGNPRDLKDTTPNVFFYVKPYYDFGNSEKPISLCLSNTIRTPDSSINQNYKNWSWIDLTRAQWEAIDRGYDSAVLTSTDGFITEGPGFGLWGIRGKVVVTPKNNCLPSITIKGLEFVCHANAIPFEYVDVTPEDFAKLDCIGIASTSGGIKQINKFEEKKFVEHPMFKSLVSLLREKYNDPLWTTKY